MVLLAFSLLGWSLFQPNRAAGETADQILRKGLGLQGMLGFTTLEGLKTVALDPTEDGARHREDLRAALEQLGIRIIKDEQKADADAVMMLRIYQSGPGFSLIQLFVFQTARLERRPGKLELVDTYRLQTPEIDTKVASTVGVMLRQFQDNYKQANHLR